MASWRRYIDLFLVMLLLAVPFFFLRASMRNPRELGAADRVLVRIGSPVEYVFAALARGVSGLVGDYVYLVDVKADNEKLSQENARLSARIREIEAAQAENVRLKKLLGLREEIDAETASAVVVAKGATEYFRVDHVVLDKPEVPVKENMPVISPEGTVGTVRRVIGGDEIDVQLSVDSGFGVDVVVERTGARGFVRGTGDRQRYTVHVEYVQRTDEVNEGDLLVTSGVGCRFPKGIPVARVTRVEKKEFGIYQSVDAKPTVDFSRLEEVLIVLTDSRDCDPKSEGGKARPKR